jgi:hypothetical protein
MTWERPALNSVIPLFLIFVEYAIGLRQGEIMSPAFVTSFLEDKELFLQDNINSE